jgi:hypothetical protein
MFGLSNPVPTTMKMRPRKNAGLAKTDERAIDRCPSAMNTPPYQIACRSPSQRSAIQPPGSPAR